MARNYQYSRDGLHKDAYAYIHGKIAFSRLARLVEGDALAQENQRRAQQGRKPANSPFTTVTLSNLTEDSFIPNDPNSPGDQFLVNYLKERVYTSQTHPEQGVSASVEDTSQRVPRVAQKTSEGVAEPVVLENDLAQGVDVYVRVKSFQSKSGNTGTGIDLVVINETGPIRYYGGGSTEGLAALGLTLQGSFPQQTQAPAQQNTGGYVAGSAQAQQSQPGFGYNQQAQAPAQQQNPGIQATDPWAAAPNQFGAPQQAPAQQAQTQEPGGLAQFGAGQSQQNQVPTQANSPFTQATPFAGSQGTANNPEGNPATGNPWEQAPANPGITYNPNQQ